MLQELLVLQVQVLLLQVQEHLAHQQQRVHLVLKVQVLRQEALVQVPHQVAQVLQVHLGHLEHVGAQEQVE